MNAKKELLDVIKGKDLLCVSMKHLKDGSFENYDLKVGYSVNDLAMFLEQIDFDYDNTKGCQNLFGYIWYKDLTWSERCEFEGCEWWAYKTCPPIPESCGSNDSLPESRATEPCGSNNYYPGTRVPYCIRKTSEVPIDETLIQHRDEPIAISTYTTSPI